MPPKPIVSKEDVFAAALSLVHRSGMESVNARSVAELLGCSTKPLFRLYQNMDELKQDLFSQINRYCSDYMHGYAGFHNDYIGVALRYINFAEEEPNLFKALFMSNAMTQTTVANMMTDQDIAGLLNEISADAEVSRREAQAIYKKMWIFSHGIASLMATNGGIFKIKEVRLILEEAYQGFVLSVKCEGENHAPIVR